MPITTPATFKGVPLGDHNWSVSKYQRTVVAHPIVRADGIVHQNVGGGQQTIQVDGWINKYSSNRQAVETFLADLITQLGNSPGTLVVSGNSYTNCYLIGIEPSADDRLINFFTLNFVRNPH
jgi:hypothetical protein